MIFIRTIIENFFSITDRVTWEMENQGLVLISGENYDSPAADSNGAGKSTLFEALVWALWGKTTRGQTGDGVVNRQAKKNCMVEVWVGHEDKTYCISRYRKHDTNGNDLEFEHYEGAYSNDLSQGTSTLTQDKVNAFLGIDYDTFIQGPMIPQGHFKKFSEMTDGEQKAIFDRALQTGVLAEALKETNDRVSLVSQRLTQDEQNYATLAEDIGDLQDTVQRYESERANWSKDKRYSLCDLAKQIVAVVEQQEVLWEQSQAIDFSKALADSKATTAHLKGQSDELKQKWDDLRTEIKDKLATARAGHRLALDALTALKTEVVDLERMEGSPCPTCRQIVNETHIKSCHHTIEKKISDKKALASSLSKQIELLESDLTNSQEAHNAAYTTIVAKLNEQETSHLKLVDEASTAKAWVNELAALNRQEFTLRKLFKQKQTETTSFNDLIDDAQRLVVTKREEMAKVRASIRRLQIDLEHLHFWQYGFSNRGLKSHILASVTPFLNERVDHHIRALAGDELSIKFNTQTTLKSGETREKFSVQVTNLHGADSYAGNSGGEKGRADLAINFVMSDLMSSRSRRPYPQRFLDEPFENLDESGVEAVMELLSDLAVDAGSIFVITHLDSMKGLFAKTLKLIKRNGVTQLEAS